MTLPSSRSGIAAAVVLTAFGIALAGLVVAKSFVAYLAVAAPQQALRLDASEPIVLIEHAEIAINVDAVKPTPQNGSGQENSSGKGGPPTRRFAFQTSDARPGTSTTIASQTSLLPPEQNNQLRASIARAVQRDPINARGFRLLGQLAEDAGDGPRTARFMEAATRRSLHESLAVYWLLRRSAATRDYTAAIRYADILLRTRSQFIAYVMPVLVNAAETKPAVTVLTRLLATNPPWRSQFFEALPASITDARTPLELFTELRETSSPPKLAEVKGYLEFLLDRSFYDLSYYTWLQLLTPDQLANAGFLFNGSFETGPSKLPFDWVFQGGQGVNIDIAGRADEPGHQALRVEFSQGRVEFGGVHQIIMLGPGRYQLKGLTKGQITGRRGVVWRLSCHGSNAGPVGESEMILGLIPPWREFQFSFTIPETDCRAQKLSLLLDARSASEQLVTGDIWFDELRISRSPATATR